MTFTGCVFVAYAIKTKPEKIRQYCLYSNMNKTARWLTHFVRAIAIKFKNQSWTVKRLVFVLEIKKKYIYIYSPFRRVSRFQVFSSAGYSFNLS